MFSIPELERITNYTVEIFKVSETGAVRYICLAPKEATLAFNRAGIKAALQASYPKGHIRCAAIRKAERSAGAGYCIEFTITFVQL